MPLPLPTGQLASPTPLVWLPADHRELGNEPHRMPFLVLGDKYIRAVRVGAHAQPVVFGLAQADQIDHLLSLVDGVMLTGSPSNVNPAHFGESVADPSLPLDAERDHLTLALVKACVAQGVPLLGVCRGFQEINVALGGSLHQQVQEVPGLMDHREPKHLPIEVQYAPAHDIAIEPASAMAVWAGGTTARVNSLHGQGVNRLASGLRAVAHAPDGLVEAFEVEAATTFACAVQWHPEWRCWENRFYAAILGAFGEACVQRRRGRPK
ncbi:MAG: gamma-glutamyl-gamma-aminobutyrate hydrolase family protein [Burkholderiaceae bacterium]|nr:gamma-glutamyl-gamma-aminobutyrate hydrolase family protein [Burkholderiaceae bacterium]